MALVQPRLLDHFALWNGILVHVFLDGLSNHSLVSANGGKRGGGGGGGGGEGDREGGREGGKKGGYRMCYSMLLQF